MNERSMMKRINDMAKRTAKMTLKKVLMKDIFSSFYLFIICCLLLKVSKKSSGAVSTLVDG